MDEKLLNEISQPVPVVAILKEIEEKLQGEEKTFQVLISLFGDFSYYLQFTTKYLYSIEDYQKSIPETSYSLKTTMDALSRGFDTLASDMMQMDEEVQKCSISQLRILAASFKQSLYNCIKQKDALMSVLSTSKSSVEKAKLSYLKSAKALETAQESLKEFVDRENDSSPRVYTETVKRKTAQVIERKQATESLLKAYKQTLTNYNKLVAKKYTECEKVTKALLKLDEDRIKAMKGLFEKYVDFLREIGSKFIAHSNSVESIVECMNTRNDVDLFISETEPQPLNPLLIPLEFEKYQYKDPTLEIIEIQSDLEEQEEIKEMKNTFEEVVFSAKPLTVERKASLIQYLHKNEGKEMLSELLSKIKQITFVSSIDAFKDIGELINSQLNAYLVDQVYDKNSLQTILNASRKVYTNIDNKHQFLYSLISDNPLWRDIGRWKEVIEFAIQQSIRISENKLKKKHSTNNFRHSVVKPVGRPRNGHSEIFSFPKILSAEAKQIMASNAFNILGQFATHFGNYHVKPEEAKRAIQYYGNFYRLEVEKLHGIELKYICYLPLEPSESNKRQNLVKKMNAYTSDVNVIVLLAVKFLNSKADLLNVLVLSKGNNETVRVDVLRQVLNTFEVSIEIRGKIWANILEASECEAKYKRILNQVKYGKFRLSAPLEELIASDVQRSFADANPSFALSVKNILRAYAHYNTKVEYCQGMHSVAGFLLHFLKSEAIAFKALTQIFNKFEMSCFFAKDVVALKRCFFQLDRLLFHHYPSLAEHLRNEEIEADLYSPTWFLTFFTGIMSYSKEIAVPPGLIAVWDFFIIDGWKAIFKTWMFIFSELQDKLLDAKFEEIMGLLGNLRNTSAFHSSAGKLRAFLNQKNITRRTLRIIEQEFDSIAEEGQEDIEDEFPDMPFKGNVLLK
eukprot:TRINITY_DN4929_c0_g1_i48.p1 TRINITY_DN4929_c0_g1~~TRINITY_DN4929_c0_g1_i48.p1  ORF type:complete len:908 (+),score=258.63 TRINITY_DN4929_c0_g1_i48:153-2876(+)